MKDTIKHIVGHLKTVHKHRREVRRLCFKCGLYWQGLTHDLSKYSPTELFTSIKYWTGTRSPIDAELEQNPYSMAWLHHMHHNKHHYEYWMDPTHMDETPRIPERYIAEMFCDRVAASKTYLGVEYTSDCPRKYLNSRPKDIQLMGEYNYKRLEYYFLILEEMGETVACDVIRTVCYNLKKNEKEK